LSISVFLPIVLPIVISSFFFLLPALCMFLTKKEDSSFIAPRCVRIITVRHNEILLICDMVLMRHISAHIHEVTISLIQLYTCILVVPSSDIG
jgi:hypothetical protein